MKSVDASDIAVIGGGVIGVASAVALQLAGHSTLLIEKGEPGRGCSFGNAGVIATSFVLPLSSLHHILAAPRMLLDPLGPLAIRFSDLPWLTPWLARFVLNATPSRQHRTIEGLRTINSMALRAWAELLDRVGSRHLLVERGMLDVARRADGVASLRAVAVRLQSLGIAMSVLDATQVGEIEPILRGRVAGGMLHEDVAHVEDPFDLTQNLLARYLEIGGRLQRENVRALSALDAGVRLTTDSGTLDVMQVVVAAGCDSAQLLTQFGIKAPLGVEHGYHLMLPQPEQMPSRPISFHAEAFLATPMFRGLRLAGTVELARASSAPNWKRADRLFDLARSYVPELRAEGATCWRGGRPSFPDGLPAIGRIAGAPQILYAFGHQHLGLTLAAITAKSIEALAGQRSPPLALDAYSLERFG